MDPGGWSHAESFGTSWYTYNKVQGHMVSLTRLLVPLEAKISSSLLCPYIVSLFFYAFAYVVQKKKRQQVLLSWGVRGTRWKPFPNSRGPNSPNNVRLFLLMMTVIKMDRHSFFVLWMPVYDGEKEKNQKYLDLIPFARFSFVSSSFLGLHFQLVLGYLIYPTTGCVVCYT